MTAMSPTASIALPSWRTGAPAMRRADAAAVLIALTLPWSTTASGIATALWVAAAFIAFDRASLLGALRHPASLAAIALVGFGAFGMMWSDAPWPMRFAAEGRFIKLLAIPLLICHFRQSERAPWVLAAFLASCTVLLLASYLQAVLWPYLWWARSQYLIGVPVKNPIAQSQEFTFCLCALGWLSVSLFRRGHRYLAMVAAVLCAAFFANMIFVVSARSALLSLPVLLAAFCLRYLSARQIAVTGFAAIVVIILTWFTSAYLRDRVDAVFSDIRRYQAADTLPSSTGQRLEFWRQSIGFVAEAPLLGHGTGSIRGLFERAAVGKTATEAEFLIVNNPHNQTLAVAIQLGLAGVILLFAMWFIHLRLFVGASGLAAWLGLAAVVQNFTSSLVNSHLFDSVEGWLYVLAVGIAGGVVLKARGRSPVKTPSTGETRAFRLSAAESAAKPAGRALFDD